MIYAKKNYHTYMHTSTYTHHTTPPPPNTHYIHTHKHICTPLTTTHTHTHMHTPYYTSYHNTHTHIGTYTHPLLSYTLPPHHTQTHPVSHLPYNDSSYRTLGSAFCFLSSCRIGTKFSKTQSSTKVHFQCALGSSTIFLSQNNHSSQLLRRGKSEQVGGGV